MVVINSEGEIKWSNDNFLDMIGRESHYGEYIQDLFNNLSINRYLESQVNVVDEFEFNGRTYLINGRAVHSDLISDTLAGLYFVDITDFMELKQDFDDKQCVQCLVVIDNNYDEVLKETPNSNHGAFALERLRGVLTHGFQMPMVYPGDMKEKSSLVFFHNKEYNDIIEKRKV